MPKDNSFLKEYFIDCQNEMRWRRETEYKLLNILVVLFPIIGIIVVAMMEWLSDTRMFFILTLSIAALLTILTILVTLKIKAENKIYKVIGQGVVKIWGYFRLFDEGAYIDGDKILDKESKSYGKGQGYLRTLYILWAVTLMIDVMLILIGIIRHYVA